MIAMLIEANVGKTSHQNRMATQWKKFRNYKRREMLTLRFHQWIAADRSRFRMPIRRSLRP